MSILDLPFEILSLIFVLCLPGDGFASSREAPLLLIAVCRHWRALVLEMHELWTTLQLRLKPRNVRKSEPLLDFWLPRAAGRRMSMRMSYKSTQDYYWDLDDNIETIGVRALVGLVSRYAEDWTEMELSLPFHALCRLNACEAGFASLCKLVIGTTSRYAANESPRMFANSPSLREVHILTNAVAARLELPWGQLTRMRLDNITATECTQILARTPNLVELVVTIWANADDHNALQPVAVESLAQLQLLRFTLSNARGPALLSFLTLPALDHLEIELDTLTEIAHLNALLVRSPANLRHLTVSLGASYTQDHFLQLFVGLDALESMIVQRANMNLDAGLALLLARRSLLPNLQSLNIERTRSIPRDTAENVALFARLLESRFFGDDDLGRARLGRFRLYSPFSTAPTKLEDVARILELQSQGLDVRVRW
uniref:F-box domain-containing protein n=1 Tax=Mycena chlorophos TaxID=658473 RepID=A0ABQ0LQ45_MYCCL|nr:predicted protein [Mycena chlorophos]